MPNPRIVRRLLWLLIVVALVTAACAGSDDPSLDTAAGATPVPTAPPEDTDSGSPQTDPEAAPDEPDAAEPDAAEPEETVDEAELSEPLVPGGGEAIPAPTQGPITGEPAFTTASKLSTVGLDEIFFGDPVAEAATKASTEWVGLPETGSSPRCYTVQPAGGPVGVVLTVLDGRIERIDITNPDITTRSGAGVGSTQAQLFDLFGDRLEETESDAGSDIMFVPADEDDQDFRIIWSTDGVVTTKMRAGRLPGVLTDAPCG